MSSAVPVLVSHRARWDLDLLPPAAAERCFDLLDQLADGSEPDAATSDTDDVLAGADALRGDFSGLHVLHRDGYRLIFRQAGDTVEVVHVDAPT